MPLVLKKNERLRGLTVQAPGGARKSFRVIATVVDDQDTKRQEQVDDDRINSINLSLKSGRITADIAAHQIGKLKENLRKELEAPEKALVRQTHDSVHQRIFEGYWEHYQTRLKKRLRNETSTINDIKRALRAVSDLNLHASKPAEFRAAVAKLEPHQRPKVIDRLNAVLAYLERGFTIPREDYRDQAMTYVTWDQLCRITAEFRSSYGREVVVPGSIIVDLANTLFGTGVRLGEAFELSRRKMFDDGRFVLVNAQWAWRYNGHTKVYEITKGARRKNSSTRENYEAMILPETLPSVERWCDYLATADAATLEHLRGSSYLYDALTTISERLFPNTPEHHIHRHSLRHSYAIYLLEHRMSVGQVATYIGDTDRVVREHYSKWILTDTMRTNDWDQMIEAKKGAKKAKKVRA